MFYFVKFFYKLDSLHADLAGLADTHYTVLAVLFAFSN